MAEIKTIPAARGNKSVELVSEQLNSTCFCISLDSGALKQALAAELDSADLMALVEERCPYLFSAVPVFVSDSHTERMARLIQAVESVVALPAYREHILSNAPAIARHDPGGAKGVFFGYDFHLSDGNIGLIEINTNAGGAMLNAVMARAHHTCCLDQQRMELASASAAALDDNIVQMFLNEWRLSKRSQPLQTIAIVDTQPQHQYLYPEFLLFQRLFQRAGLHAVIVDPSELELRQGQLWHGDIVIDLVYNRLTDFMLESDACAALRLAYLEHAVVLTPHPQAHALYADKRNLVLLADADRLQALGVPPDVRSVLSANILHTEVVDAANAERLWSQRRQLFFKPTAGYGSRATYRGDKLTKRVWEDILAGDYVAQAIMAPGERIGGSKGNPQPLKFDLRSYVYDGKVQWTAARMYQGQTTNFRTLGGGFAPVYSLPDAHMSDQTAMLMDAAADAMACCRSTCG